MINKLGRKQIQVRCSVNCHDQCNPVGMLYSVTDPEGKITTYDCRNRLVSTGGITYTYDPENTRISAESDTSKEVYVTENVSGTYSRVLTMTVYEKENGTVKGEGKETFYVYGSGLIYEKTGDSILYHHYNNLGSTILLMTGTFAYKEVVDVNAHDGVTELAHVTITPQDELSVDGDQGATAGTESDASESETIDSTTNHPYFVVGYGYVDAGNLRTGDTILLANGEKGTVKSVDIEFLEEPVTVYNFEVKDWHCYFVGEVGVLVHNVKKYVKLLQRLPEAPLEKRGEILVRVVQLQIKVEVENKNVFKKLPMMIRFHLH